MAGPQAVFDGSEDPGIPPYAPECVERAVPGFGSTWVHGYSGRDVAAWRKDAARMAGPGREPTPEMLAVAQAAYVCRTGPGSQQRTFQITIQEADRAFRWLADNLPGRFVEVVCRESDALTMAGYVPTRRDGRAEAAQRLGEQLADREFWAHLDYLSRVVCGVRLADNGEPLGEVLGVLEREVEHRQMLVEVLLQLSQAAGGGV